MEKSNLTNKIKELQQLSNRNNLNHISIKLDKIEKELLSQNVIIPLVGRFTSGKSSLINALLEDNLLKVGIEAKTAIKQEIRRGGNSVLINEEGILRKISIDEFKKIDDRDFGSKILSADISIDNQCLPSNIILMDLPGLESGYTKHDEVIADTMPNIHSMIVTVAVSEGALHNSVLKFLSDFNVINQSIYLLITMSDVNYSKSAEEVKLQCERQLKNIGVNLKGSFITSASKVNPDIFGLKEILKDISANADNFIIGKVNNDLLECSDILLSALKNIKQNSNLSLDDLYRKLKEFNNSRYEIDKEMNNEISKFKINIRKCIPDIAREMGGYFESNVDVLVDAAMKKEEDFIYAYNTTMKNALQIVLIPSLHTAVEDNISKFEDSIKNIQLQIPNLDTAMLENLKKIILLLTQIIKIDKLIKIIKKIKILKKITKIPKGVWDIALMIITDWAVNKLTKAYIRNELLKSFKHSLIHQLESEIKEIVNEIILEIESKIKDSFLNRINTHEDSLKELISQIENKKNEFNLFVEQLLNDIQFIQSMKSELSII